MDHQESQTKFPFAIREVPEGSIEFLGIPMPPSSNSQYMIGKCGQSRRLISSDKLIEYKRAMEDYRLSNLRLFQTYKPLIQAWRKNHCFLKVDAQFFFQRSRILNLNDIPEKLDVSNRVKGLHDCIATWLDIDDRYYWEIGARKCILEKGRVENVTVKIGAIL